MSKFRLKLDLSNFFTDERKYAFILINPCWEKIRSLEDHVEKLFDLETIKFLTDDSCFLPSLESIEIVKQSDVLKAIATGHNKKPKKSKKKKEQHEDDPLMRDEDVGKRKLTPESSTTNSTHNKKKKFKTAVAEVNPSISSDEICNGLLSTNKAVLVNGAANSNPTTEGANHLDSCEKNPKCGKRTRKRKSKTQKRSCMENNDPTEEVQLPPKKKNLNLNHTRFHENESEKSYDDNFVILENFADSLSSVTARVIKSEEVSPPKSEKSKNKIEIIENILLTNGICNDQSVIEINSSAIVSDENNERTALNNSGDNSELVPKDNEGSTETENSSINNSNIKLADLLEYSNDLEGLPAIGDIVFFKVYRLSENYEPGLSDYVWGKCDSIDDDSVLKIFILGGHDQIKEHNGKFSIATDEDVADLVKKQKYFCINIVEMFEKRVFKILENFI